ncbi:MAG: LamG-like jellyroll fold domain-containing protein, partial [Salibacteraceae bacterium]
MNFKSNLSKLAALIVVFILATFKISLSQSTELQPQFFDNGNNIDVYFNIEAWKHTDIPWSPNYDHLAQMNLSWNGQIIVRATHSGLYAGGLSAVDYSTTHPSITRFEYAGDYNIFTLKTIENDITVTYENSVAHNGTYDVTQIHLTIPKSALAKLQTTDISDKIELYSYYYMRSPGGNSNQYAGTHYSTILNVKAYEEDIYGVDEVDFSATLNSDDGYVELKFRAEKRDGEHKYDHAGCLYLVEKNNTDNTTKRIAQLSHSSLSCTHPTGYPTYTTTGIGNDNYTFSVFDNNKVDIKEVKRTHAPTSWHHFEYDQTTDDDAYFVVKYYLDAEDFSDDIDYYVDGLYYVKDNYGVSNTVQTQYWWGSNTKSISANDNYNMPSVSNLTVSPSTSQCEIDLTWTSYSSFALSSSEYVGIFRNGNLIGKVLNSNTTSFTDTAITAGQTYNYQLASLYQRSYNNDFQGLLSPAVSGSIPLANAPTGITLAQGSCGSDIQVDWVWTGADPNSFTIERKTANTSFTTLVNNVAGGARSFTDNNNIISGEVYTYRIAATDNICQQLGDFSTAATLTGDTIDLSVTLEENGLTTSKGYFNDRTELNWRTTSNNNQYINRFRIYTRELGSTALPSLVQTVDETQISWTHTTGNAGVVYEYFLVAERVVTTQCGSVVTKSFEISSLENATTASALPSNGLGVATAVGFRFPTAVVNGNISYAGGVSVPNVKVIAEKYSGQNGASLYFDGSGDYVSIPHSTTTMPDTAFTISMWVKPESLGSSVLFQKNGSFGIEYDGVGQKPFIFVRDTNYTAYTLSGDTGTMQIGTWANLTATYSASTGEMKLYVDGVLSGGVRTLPVGLRQINPSTTPTYIGCQNNGSFGYFFQGNIDEVKIFNRALNAQEVQRSAGAVSPTDAPGLQGYWKFFVGVGHRAYDAAHHGSFYHKNDGVIANATWSSVIPPVSKLGYAGYTDANGNYSISGIGYSNLGENFNIVPTTTLAGAVHEFDPSTRTLFVGDGANIHNNIDFEDVSSFTVQGNVKYLFDNEDGINFKSSGSSGIRLYLDGQTVMTGSANQIIETDTAGFFSVDIPIGEHYIEFRKNGHTFQGGGNFPATGNWDFQSDLTGLEIWDETLHTFAGKVVGGTHEGDKLLGFNQTVNNIGKAYFTLTSDDGKIVRTITTDSLTGEFFIDLPPKKYNVSSVKWSSNNVDIINSGDIKAIELGNISAYQIVEEIDSVNADTTRYNVRKDFIYRNIPELIVSDTNGTGMPSEQYYPIITGNTADTIMVDLTTLKFPTYKSGAKYDLKMKAVELYINQDNATVDTVAVTDGVLTVNNGIGEGFLIDEDENQVAYG